MAKDNIPVSSEVLTRLAQLEQTVKILAQRKMRRQSNPMVCESTDEYERRVLRYFVFDRPVH